MTRCYYPHTSRESVSALSRIFFVKNLYSQVGLKKGFGFIKHLVMIFLMYLWNACLTKSLEIVSWNSDRMFPHESIRNSKQFWNCMISWIFMAIWYGKCVGIADVSFCKGVLLAQGMSISKKGYPIYWLKTRIRETLNILMCGDSCTDTKKS